MKQFDLQEYLKNPNRRIITRTGLPVRIICTNADSKQCVIGLVRLKEENAALYYYKDGRHLEESDSNQDLFFAPEKHEGWINIYRSPTLGYVYSPGRVFNTEEEALCHHTTGGVMKSLGTCKIEWEE